MYKVFVNNKPLTFSTNITNSEKNIPFQNLSDFAVAVHLLNDNCSSVNIYAPHVDKVWEAFCSYYKNIFAAGGVVLNEKDEMLWIYRLNKWDLPKGKMEKGENREDTAVREVEEECGISGLIITQSLPTTYHMYYHKEYILKITYWFEMLYTGNEELIAQKEEGITEVKWINKTALEEIKQNTYANILQLIAPYADSTTNSNNS